MLLQPRLKNLFYAQLKIQFTPIPCVLELDDVLLTNRAIESQTVGVQLRA